MTDLMTLTTKSFQITRMVSAILGKFENVMAVAVRVFSLQITTLAGSFIALIHELLEHNPLLNGWATVPGETDSRKIIHSKSCHTLPYHILPDRTSPRPTKTGHTKPFPAWPSPTHTTKWEPYQTPPHTNLPHRASPDLDRHHQTQASAYLATKESHALPCLTRPSLTCPSRATPRLARPRHFQTLPQRIYL